MAGLRTQDQPDAPGIQAKTQMLRMDILDLGLRPPTEQSPVTSKAAVARNRARR